MIAIVFSAALAARPSTKEAPPRPVDAAKARRGGRRILSRALRALRRSSIAAVNIDGGFAAPGNADAS